ncbi:hypothetical protein MTR67_032798 [Solanum verrucosum]|uniref:Protein kinase domain-containing protein n=1 Tax=Solanum verrucosum TaxID=315347 RepID=A0AAF0U4W7_SOLVR|nr:hypothetical protein MTR67_032798 [Solanum verrucosum]
MTKVPHRWLMRWVDFLEGLGNPPPFELAFGVKLGKGGFGSVYEGTLSNGTKIAVKHLDGVGQVKESFLTEVKTVSGIHHINLVKLIGFCAEKSHRLLIYEYMVNGSLDRWITQENGLTWHKRQMVILTGQRLRYFVHWNINFDLDFGI